MSSAEELLAERDLVLRQAEELKERIAAARPVELENQLYELTLRAKVLSEAAARAAELNRHAACIKNIQELPFDVLSRRAQVDVFKKSTDFCSRPPTAMLENTRASDKSPACVCIAEFAGVWEIYASTDSTIEDLKRNALKRLADTIKTCDDSRFEVGDTAEWLVRDEYDHVLDHVLVVVKNEPNVRVMRMDVKCDPEKLVSWIRGTIEWGEDAEGWERVRRVRRESPDKKSIVLELEPVADPDESD